MIFSDGQKRVIDTLKLKTQKANELFTLLNSSVNATHEVKKNEFTKEILLPNFL